MIELRGWGVAEDITMRRFSLLGGQFLGVRTQEDTDESQLIKSNSVLFKAIRLSTL